jgi:hypothetical protein
MLVALSVFMFLFACGDGNPVQPDADISLNPDAPEVSIAAKRGGVKMIPFKGHGEGWPENAVSTGEEVEACLAAGGVSWGAASLPMNVTHMGKVDYHFFQCWDAGFGLALYMGKVVAANGDELTFIGPPEGGWEVFEIDWFTVPHPWRFSPLIITGGTGRFANATGSFEAWGESEYHPDVDRWYGPETWEGWISSVGSSK